MIQHCAELVGANLVKADLNPKFQRAHQVESAPDEQTLLCALGGVQSVQRAVVAPLIIVLRSFGAQAGIAQFLPAQGPMHQDVGGGLREYIDGRGDLRADRTNAHVRVGHTHPRLPA